jgi:putative flippase GtrA
MKNADTKPDIFDRLMSKGFLKKFEPFYRLHKEILMYLFFGGCTTIVGIIFYAIPIMLINLPDVTLFGIKINTAVQVSNVISWICAVTFAYVTNRTWVFEDKAHGAKDTARECFAFFAGRLVTLIIENILLNIAAASLGMDEIIAKIAVSVITVILNYIISKLFVFKEK